MNTEEPEPQDELGPEPIAYVVAMDTFKDLFPHCRNIVMWCEEVYE